MLKEAFKAFGEPQSASVRECTREEKQLKFGFVLMNTKEEASEVLLNGIIHPDILALTSVNPAFIKLAQSKIVR